MFTLPSTGVCWYRMDDPGGKPQGYARLELTGEEGGGLQITWELRIGWSGGSYEEDRTLAFDANWRMVAAGMMVKGQLVSNGRAVDEGWRFDTAEEEGQHRELPEHAVSGMGFLLALALPLVEDLHHTVFEIDESGAFADLGAATFTRKGAETLTVEEQEMPTHHLELARADGNVLPVWVGHDRTLVRVDWGGGNLMTLSRSCTRHLFDPPPPAVAIQECGPETLVVAGDYAAFTPEELWDHFTSAKLLITWWPQKADLELEVGGKYHLSWPGAGGWFLRGAIQALERGTHLAFTWMWDHDKGEVAPLRVSVDLAHRSEGGTRLTLTHGPYTETPASQASRNEHLSGWCNCLTRLRDLRPS